MTLYMGSREGEVWHVGPAEAAACSKGESRVATLPRRVPTHIHPRLVAVPGQWLVNVEHQFVPKQQRSLLHDSGCRNVTKQQLRAGWVMCGAPAPGSAGLPLVSRLLLVQYR